MNPAAPRPRRPLLALLGRVVRWTLWLVLAVALVVQLRILADGGLRVPDSVLDFAARRIAARHGLDVRAEAVWLDPRGRVLVIEPRVGLAGSENRADFASARAISLKLRRRELLRGGLVATRAEIAGLDLHLPAAHSPSGVMQPLLEGGEFRLALPVGETTWRVEQASGRVLGVPTAFTGVLPAAGTPKEPLASPEENVRRGLRLAADVYRRVGALPIDSIRSLRIELADERVVVSTGAKSLSVPAHPALPDRLAGASLSEAELALAIPFDDPTRAELRLRAADLQAPAELALESGPVDLFLRASPDRELFLDLAAAYIRKTDSHLPPVPLVASLAWSRDTGLVRARLVARLADAPWSIEAEGSPAARSASARAAGRLTPALLEEIRPFLPPKARPVLTIADPVSVEAEGSLADGRPGPVSVRAVSGRAVAHHVPFDRASAVLRYDHAAGFVRADELVLVQADSRAAGSYEMDTRTLAFRFLLGGPFRPMSIAGWFSGWWGRFWDDFAFGPSPAIADVDIQGAWRDPERVTLFVGASSGPMKLRAQQLDALVTRVRVEHNFFDILGFRGTQGPFAADGRFSQRLAADGEWSHLTFEVRSDFPASALPNLFPDDGPELIAPFSLTAPPHVRLVGETFGPGAPAGEAGRQRYVLDLSAPAPLRYEGFPLDHLALRLERRDSDLKLTGIRAGFADGLASGEAAISGPDDDRWLAFDLALVGAKPDLMLERWREFQAARPAAATAAGQPDTKEGEDDHKLGGALNLALAATGPLADPLAYSGHGTASIADADLARIRLLGGLSSVLSDLGIGITTLRLTDTTTDFTLRRNELVFDELKITGPSASVEARGAYMLPEGELDFTAKIRPFDQRGGLLSSAAGLVFSPFTHALEVELRGTLEDPDWTFSYGPTKLLRRITGLDGKKSVKTEDKPSTKPIPSEHAPQTP